MKATDGVTIIQTQPTYGSFPIVFADVPVTFTDAQGKQVHKAQSLAYIDGPYIIMVFFPIYTLLNCMIMLLTHKHCYTQQ